MEQFYTENIKTLECSANNITYFNESSSKKDNDEKMIKENKDLKEKVNKLEERVKFLKKRSIMKDNKKISFIVKNAIYIALVHELNILQKDFKYKKEKIKEQLIKLKIDQKEKFKLKVQKMNKLTTFYLS